MAVSKNRRKNNKKINKNKRKNSMSRLIEESRQQFMGQYYNANNALNQLQELINQYNLLKWAVETPAQIIEKADEKFNRYVPIVNESVNNLNNLYNEHMVMREMYSSNKISPEDTNWMYIELHQKLLEVLNHIGYLVESGIPDMEVAFNAKYNYRGLN